jgi:hypothetical protein
MLQYLYRKYIILFVLINFLLSFLQVFAEERRRASDRIISATRQHEETIKQMVLKMMDLGSDLS